MPRVLDQSIVKFALPFAEKEAHNLLPTGDELGPVAPDTVKRISERYLLRIARVPVVLGLPYFRDCSLAREGFPVDSILPYVAVCCHDNEQSHLAAKTGHGHTRPHTGRDVRTAGGASRYALFARSRRDGGRRRSADGLPL